MIKCIKSVTSVWLSWISYSLLMIFGWHQQCSMPIRKSMMIGHFDEKWNVWIYLLYLYAEGAATNVVIVVDKVKWWMKLLPFVSLSPICKIQNFNTLFKDKSVLIPFESFKSCVDCCLQVASDHNMSLLCMKLCNNPCRRHLITGNIDCEITPQTEEQVYLAIDSFMRVNKVYFDDDNEGWFNPLTVGCYLLLTPLFFTRAIDLLVICWTSWFVAFKFHYHYELNEKSNKTYYMWFEYLVMYAVVRWFISSISWSLFWAKVGCLFIMFQLALQGGNRSEYYYRPYLYVNCCLLKYILIVAVALA